MQPFPEEPQDLHPWPRRPKRLATAVVEELTDRIVGGELPSGSVLPIEPVLCEMFGVSRTVVREAVKSLEAMRLVRAQQGQGTTVRHFEEWDLLNPVVLAASVRHDAEMAILDDLIDTRCALESQMAAQAAERATDAEVEAISAHMARLYDEVDDPARYLRADLAFHDAIMRASGNRLARAVIHTINAEAFRSFRYLGETTPADCRESNVAHQAIHDRIVARDTGGADTAMTDHIRGSWHRRRPKDGARPPKRAAADS